MLMDRSERFHQTSDSELLRVVLPALLLVNDALQYVVASSDFDQVCKRFSWAGL